MLISPHSNSPILNLPTILIFVPTCLKLNSDDNIENSTLHAFKLCQCMSCKFINEFSYADVIVLNLSSSSSLNTNRNIVANRASHQMLLQTNWQVFQIIWCFRQVGTKFKVVGELGLGKMGVPHVSVVQFQIHCNNYYFDHVISTKYLLQQKKVDEEQFSILLPNFFLLLQ